MHRVLTGSCNDAWKEKVGAIRNFDTGTTSDQHKKFKTLLQKFNKDYFAGDALKSWKAAMRNG